MLAFGNREGKIIIKENKVDIKVGFNIEMMSLVFKVDK